VEVGDGMNREAQIIV